MHSIAPFAFYAREMDFFDLFFANLKKLKQKLKIYVQKLHQLLGLIVATILRNGSFQTWHKYEKSLLETRTFSWAKKYLRLLCVRGDWKDVWRREAERELCEDQKNYLS